MATKTQPAAAEAAAPASFGDAFLLVRIRHHRPEFAPKLQKVKAELGGLAITEDKLKTKAVLLPEDMREALSAAFGVVDAVRDEYTRPYPQLDAVRFLPRDRARAFFAAFDAARAAFHAILDRDFYPRYEERVRAAALAEWGPKLGDDYERLVGRFVPPEEALRPRIDVEAVKFSVSYEDRETADAAMKEVAESLRADLAAAVEAVKDRLAAGSRLKPESFNGLRDAIAAVRGFAAFADARLLAEIDGVERGVDRAADAARAAATLRGSMTDTIRSMAPALSRGLDSLLDACRDRGGVEAAVDRFGGVRRIRVHGAGGS